MTVKIVTFIEPEKWDVFVFNHPEGNIFQTRYMYDVYSNTKGYIAKVFFAVDESNEILGLISGVGITEMDGVFSTFSRHGVVHGGPLFSEKLASDDRKLLINAYDAALNKYLIYNDIRNMCDQSKLNDTLSGYLYHEHLNFLIDISQSEEDLWKAIHKPRRKNINRSEKQGVVIVEMSNLDYMDEFIRLINETYTNVKIPYPDRSLFENAMNYLLPKKYVKFFIAKNEANHIIGCRAVLLYKDMVYDWYAGADHNYLDLYPNDILVWHILKWGSANKYAVFDFGGAGEPDKPYGPREFKRRFGGELVNYGRYTRIYSPLKLWIAKKGMFLYQKIK